MAAGAGAVALGLVHNWTGFSLCAAATVVPLWIGLRRIERFEF